MKKIKRYFLIAVLAAAVLILYGATVVYAGVSNKVICDTDDFSSGLNMGEWYTSDNDITGTDEGILFREELSAGSRVASRTQLFNPQSDPLAESFSAELTLKVQKQIEGRIAMAFGLRLPNTEIGSANTTSVYLVTEENKLLLGVSAYDGQGAKRNIFAASDTGIVLSGSGAEVKLSLSVSQGGGITVSVGERELVSEEKADCAASGYFSMGITAKGNRFVVEKIRISGYTNNTPENTNIMEDFDKNCFNTIDLRTSLPSKGEGSILPANGRLEFSGVTEGYVGTRNRYSNAEIAFDLSFIRGEPSYGENGELTAPISAGFSIALGCTSSDSMAVNSAVKIKIVPEGGNNILTPSAAGLEIYTGTELTEKLLLPRAYNIWNGDAVQGRRIGFVIDAQDGTVRVGMRYEDEIGYTNVYSGRFDKNPDGFIQILAEGTPYSQLGSLSAASVKKCDFAIDNVSVTNMDKNAHVVVSEYAPSYSEVEDFVYHGGWDDDDMLFFN